MNEVNESQWKTLIEHNGPYVRFDIDYLLIKSDDNQYQITIIDYNHNNTYKFGPFDNKKKAEESINNYKQKLIDLANYEKHLKL